MEERVTPGVLSVVASTGQHLIRLEMGCTNRSETSTSSMRRSILDLVDYLGRDQRFEAGCVLLTGTGIVPPSDFTLQDGDEVRIRIDGIGLLENPVRRHASRSESDHQ